MFDFIEGKLEKQGPSHVVLNCHGVGYHLEISLNTFVRIKEMSQVRLLTHFIVREDVQCLYGFFDERERFLFRLLIGISGIGANTARMILSSLTVDEVTRAIASGDSMQIQSVKGIGAKTAQRVILELRDKLAQDGIEIQNITLSDNKHKEEALSALVMLGFNKGSSEKVLNQILSRSPDETVEQLVKQALKLL